MGARPWELGPCKVGFRGAQGHWWPLFWGLISCLGGGGSEPSPRAGSQGSLSCFPPIPPCPSFPCLSSQGWVVCTRGWGCLPVPRFPLLGNGNCVVPGTAWDEAGSEGGPLQPGETVLHWISASGVGCAFAAGSLAPREVVQDVSWDRLSLLRLTPVPPGCSSIDEGRRKQTSTLAMR